MVVALQQVQNRVAEIRGELPADTDLTVERLTPAVFPVLILNLTGTLPTADLNDYALYVIRPALARVPGAGHIEVLASDTREIEVILDPAKLTAAGLTVGDVADALKAQNQLQPVGRFAETGLQHLALASGLWTIVDQTSPHAPVLVKDGATIRVADLGTVVAGRARSHAARHRQRARRGRRSASRSRSAPTSSTLKHGVDAALAELAHALPAGLTHHQGLRPRRVRRARPSPTCATRS